MTAEEKGFNYELYNNYRQIADSFINNIPFYYEGTIEDWVLKSLPMIKEFNKDDDFEASKAIKDSIIAFINKYIPNEKDRISFDAIIKAEFLK